MNRPESVKVFFYGTEYYRYPTPFEGEWRTDFAHMRDLGFNIVKTESAWASMEPKEGKYIFDEMDRLVDMCEEHGMSFIPNVQWEAAPGWLYRKSEVAHVSPWGLRIPKVTYGNAYVGWLMPCFDSPVTREVCGRFMETFVERYRSRACIPAWDVWVEPRSRPGEECACEYSAAAYRAWLVEQFGSIDKFNRRFYKRIGSWDDLVPPAASPEYAELYLWRQWACESVADRVRWAADVHRRVDPSRPVMTHVGGCTLIQDPVNDSGDDFLTSRQVDFYGSSLPAPTLSKLDGEEYRRGVLQVPMINDWIRSHSKYFWIMEIYPDNVEGNNLFCRKKEAEDVRFDLWTCLGHGASGMEFWQYRPELFGYESRCYGLMDNDGSANERSAVAGSIGQLLKRHSEFFHEAYPEPAEVAIFFDKRSDLVRYLEGSTTPEVGRPGGHENPDNLYKKAHFGCYRLFYEQNIPVDYVTPHSIERLRDYTVCVLPMSVVMDDHIAEALRGFVEGGGLLIGEICTGMRADNTLCNTTVPGSGLDRLFGCTEHEVEPVKNRQRHYLWSEHCVSSGRFSTCLSATGGEILARWEDNHRPAVVAQKSGQGMAIYFATDLSLAAYAGDQATQLVVSELLQNHDVSAPVEVSPSPQITARLLRRNAERALLLTNHARETVCAVVKYPLFQDTECLTGQNCDSAPEQLSVTIGPRDIAVVIGRV